MSIHVNKPWRHPGEGRGPDVVAVLDSGLCRNDGIGTE